MRTVSVFAAACVGGLLATLAPTTEAWAGGVGVLGNFGFRTQPVYFYDKSAEFQQFKITEQIIGFGGGFEVILGDRDDRILGIFRAYWLHELPETHPREVTGLVDPEDVVATVRDEPREVGVGSVGLSWGVIGSPDGFMVNAVGAMGSGFLTTDHTEYFQVELGGGVSYRLDSGFQFFGDVAYQVRFRKDSFHGPVLFAGARYLFD